MKFKIISDLSYEVYSPCTFIFNILASKTSRQQILKESLIISQDIKFEEFTLKNSETRFIKLVVPGKMNFSISYNAEVSVEHNILDEKSLRSAIPIIKMDHEILRYISPSRHCESDQFIKFAQKEFGTYQDKYTKAVAINNWIYKNIEYSNATTNSSTSARETFIRREGVCKDFAHLGITFCRALDIPARYFTGYACQLFPPDIHACFEAYIGGNWLIFDPSRLCPINGFVKIANGIDASEAAIASFFGETFCTRMNIQCDALDSNFTPYTFSTDKIEAFSY